MKEITELKDKHKGEDIYIIASGATMNHFSRKFFEGRTVIGLNRIYEFFPCTYMLTHHHNIVQECIDFGVPVITSEFGTCVFKAPRHNFKGEYYYYKHTPQGYSGVDLSCFPEFIGAAGTPVVAAIQVAVIMGASNVVLCGVDGGKLDGISNYHKYPLPSQVGHPGRVQNAINLTASMVRKLGVGVCSIIPFTNLTLEGHVFEASDGKWGEFTEAEKDKINQFREKNGHPKVVWTADDKGGLKDSGI